MELFQEVVKFQINSTFSYQKGFYFINFSFFSSFTNYELIYEFSFFAQRIDRKSSKLLWFCPWLAEILGLQTNKGLKSLTEIASPPQSENSFGFSLIEKKTPLQDPLPFFSNCKASAIVWFINHLWLWLIKREVIWLLYSCELLFVCSSSWLYINICIKYGYCILIMVLFMVVEVCGAVEPNRARLSFDYRRPQGPSKGPSVISWSHRWSTDHQSEINERPDKGAAIRTFKLTQNVQCRE